MGHTVEKITAKPQKVIRRISRGNQVTLPPHFLKENGLHIGDSVEILEEKGKVTIKPLTILGSQEKEHFIQKIQMPMKFFLYLLVIFHVILHNYL